MKIAYLILLHQHSSQFKKLFKAIYHPANYYLIHVDRKAHASIRSIVKGSLSHFSNAYLMKSENVVWGGYSMVDVELKGIKELLAIGRDWDFLINLSGQDFPLKSQPFIQDYLSSKKGTEFINVLNQKKERPETMFRIQYIYFEFRNSMIRIPIRRQYLKGKTPYSGHQWFILTRDFCEFICQSSEVKELERFYRNTLIPDEGFFQSVLMNTSYNSIIENDNKRLIKWVPTKRGKSRPKILTLDDLGSLQASEAFFARKFDESVDSIIFDRMETKLLYS